MTVTEVVVRSPYTSSSHVRASWKAPTTSPPAKYVLKVTDLTTNESLSIDQTSTSADVNDLKAGTRYRFELSCAPTSCEVSTDSVVEAETPKEVWQLQGSGATTPGLTRIVSDGNVRIHGFRFGADAPAELAGKIQLYYGPMGSSASGLVVATTSTAASAATPASYLSLTSYASTSGVHNPPSKSTLIGQVNAGQAIPLSASLGGNVRLFFEAEGSDNKTRIMFIDSKDGYVGKDFNSGGSTVCATAADYESTGGCAPKVVIGVAGDSGFAGSKIANARQFKIALPTRTDWRWDGAAGTFMVFTTERLGGCFDGMGHGYAVWNGTDWVVQYAADGCPKFFSGVQAAHPVHLGGARFKMYFGNPTETSGKVAGSRLPFVGPKRMIYAEGARTADASTVEFEDWDTVKQARDVVFLWPDGSQLDAKAEGYIDDFTYVWPTNDPALQVMYLAITDGNEVPFATAALLLNP